MHMSLCTCVCVYACIVCVRLSVCMRVSICKCVCVSMCVYVCMHNCAYVFLCIVCPRVYILCVHVCTGVDVCISVCVYVSICVPICGGVHCFCIDATACASVCEHYRSMSSVFQRPLQYFYFMFIRVLPVCLSCESVRFWGLLSCELPCGCWKLNLFLWKNS